MIQHTTHVMRDMCVLSGTTQRPRRSSRGRCNHRKPPTLRRRTLRRVRRVRHVPRTARRLRRHHRPEREVAGGRAARARRAHRRAGPAEKSRRELISVVRFWRRGT